MKRGSFDKAYNAVCTKSTQSKVPIDDHPAELLKSSWSMKWPSFKNETDTQLKPTKSNPNLFLLGCDLRFSRWSYLEICPWKCPTSGLQKFWKSISCHITYSFPLAGSSLNLFAIYAAMQPKSKNMKKLTQCIILCFSEESTKSTETNKSSIIPVMLVLRG